MLRTLALVFSSLLLTACSDFCAGCIIDDGDDPEPESSCIEVEQAEPLTLGHFVGDEFKALVEGDALALEYGPQGGQHVFVAIHTTESEPGEVVLMSFEEDGSETPASEQATLLDSDCEMTAELRDVRILVFSEVATGLLRARIGSCPASNCIFDDLGQVTNFTMRSEVSVQVGVD